MISYDTTFPTAVIFSSAHSAKFIHVCSILRLSSKTVLKHLILINAFFESFSM